MTFENRLTSESFRTLCEANVARREFLLHSIFFSGSANLRCTNAGWKVLRHRSFAKRNVFMSQVFAAVCTSSDRRISRSRYCPDWFKYLHYF